MRNLAITLLLSAITAIAVPSMAIADNERSIALILDASGSMQATLNSGEKRIDAAKAAVETFVKTAKDEIRLSLWAYGHQSPRKDKNCADIEQLTGYGPIGSNRGMVIGKAKALTAQGYTPISDILELAANDLRSESDSKSRAVVLVSDGKETCAGDPCAVAKALAAADADLVVHTIGFAVDVAARYELQCIAKHARGNYYEAEDIQKLNESLSSVVKAEAVMPPEPVKVKAPKPGSLQLANSSASRHAVYNSETGEEVGHLSAVTPAIELPAGIYKVQFGSAFWRGIEVKDSEPTAIDTAILSLPMASFRGHLVLDPETGEEIISLSSKSSSVNLMPSSFDVMFGTMPYRVELQPGTRTEVPAGSVDVEGLPINYRSIYNEAGEEVIAISATGSSATLLEGKYELEHNDKRYPFTIVNGETVKVVIE